MTPSLSRAGAWSGILIAIAYVVITGLYVAAGPVPSSIDGGEWLAYLGDRTAVWWGIIGLSVVTNLLYPPVAAALVPVLGTERRLLALAGSTLLATFVMLDLAVTWPTYGALMRLADLGVPGVLTSGQPVFAAAGAAATLDSALFAVYAILLPSLGILLLGLAMLDRFSRAAGWTGIGTGVLGTVAVIGGFAVDGLGALAIPASILTAAWFALVGYRLLRHLA